jgi:alpha-tubulin suppressor-like RCC1 family protein
MEYQKSAFRRWFPLLSVSLMSVLALSCTPCVPPVPVLSGVTQIAAGFNQSCAVVAGGAVKCWGNNSYGQLGDGTNTDSPVAVDVLPGA